MPQLGCVSMCPARMFEGPRVVVERVFACLRLCAPPLRRPHLLVPSRAAVSITYHYSMSLLDAATRQRTRSARSARSSTPTHRLAHPTCPHPPPLPAARQWHCASSVHTRAYNTRALSSDAAHGRRTASRTHPTRANAAGLMRTTRGTPRRCARRTPSAERLRSSGFKHWHVVLVASAWLVGESADRYARYVALYA